MQSIDLDLVERFTGQRQISSVEAALRELQPIESALSAADASAALLAGRLSTAMKRRGWAVARLRISKLPKMFGAPPWVIGLVVCGIVSFLVGIVLVFVFHAGSLAIIFGTFAPFAGLGLVPFLFPIDLARLERHLNDKREQVASIEQEQAAAQRMLENFRQRVVEARRIYDGLIRARDFPRSRLLEVDYKQLSETEFEQFLTDVFRFLGYAVRSTARSGDQGVDLLVEREGKTFAVKAKSFCPSVGNSAVQEVHTGMSVYARRGTACHQCAVITASGFTAGAMEAARAVNCWLISGDQIAQLIKGEISL